MNHPTKGRTGLSRVIHAAGYSWSGLRSAYSRESAFRQEAWLAFVLLPFAFWLGTNWLERALLAGSVVAVLVVELLNSAIEATVDRISTESHELAAIAKDMASAAVMLSLLFCLGVWGAALWARAAHGL